MIAKFNHFCKTVLIAVISTIIINACILKNITHDYDYEVETKVHSEDHTMSSYKDENNTISKLLKTQFYEDKLNSPVVLEDYKLMWFLNPKCASTSTRYLLYVFYCNCNAFI